MMKMIDNSPKAARFSVIFIFIAILSMPMFYFLESALRVSGCNPNPAQPDNFMAYCWKKGYADYEHGAYWLPTESEALDAAREAEILFLGNSRMQYALSTEVLDEFSTNTGFDHYLLGFSGEGSRFVKNLIARHDLHPKMLVVNLDGIEFFDHPRTTTATAVNLEAKPMSSWVAFSMKRTGQDLQRALCPGDFWFPGKARFCHVEDTVYRTITNGHWETAHRQGIGNAFPIAPTAPMPVQWQTNKETIAAEARHFTKTMQDKGICVVAINVPESNTSDAVAIEQAALMGVPLILTDRAGLNSFDHSHLTPQSARRYSSDVVKQLTHLMARCGG